MPYFAWFGILGLVLLYAAAIVMFLVKQKNMIAPALSLSAWQRAAISLTVHAVG